MKWKNIMNEFINPNVASAESIIDYFTKINGNNKKEAVKAITIWAERAKLRCAKNDEEKINDIVKKAKEL